MRGYSIAEEECPHLLYDSPTLHLDLMSRKAEPGAQGAPELLPMTDLLRVEPDSTATTAGEESRE